MKPEDFGIKIPTDLNEDLFRKGFAHGMKSNTLTIFKKSYCEGFREAKLLCQEIRKTQGIFSFPLKARVRFTSNGLNDTSSK